MTRTCPGRSGLRFTSAMLSAVLWKTYFFEPSSPPPRGRRGRWIFRILGDFFILFFYITCAGRGLLPLAGLWGAEGRGGEGGLRTCEVTAYGPKWMAGMIGLICTYREIIMEDVGDKRFLSLFCHWQKGGVTLI